MWQSNLALIECPNAIDPSWQGSRRSFAVTIGNRVGFAHTKPVRRSLTTGSCLLENSKLAYMTRPRRKMNTCQRFLRGCSGTEGCSSAALSFPRELGLSESGGISAWFRALPRALFLPSSSSCSVICAARSSAAFLLPRFRFV
jgi:hypothetical protein